MKRRSERVKKQKSATENILKKACKVKWQQFEPWIQKGCEEHIEKNKEV